MARGRRATGRLPPDRRRGPGANRTRGRRTEQASGEGEPGRTAGELQKDSVRHACNHRRRAARRRGGAGRDHQLHQYVQPQAAGGRRAAGAQGRFPGPAPAAVDQDLVHAGLSRRHRLSAGQRTAGRAGRTGLSYRRLRLRHLRRPLRRADVRGRARHRRRQSPRSRGALGQSQFPRTRPPAGPRELPGVSRAGRRLRPGRYGGTGPRHGAGRVAAGWFAHTSGRAVAQRRRDRNLLQREPCFVPGP
ncbi:hypothetical protein D9M68_681330 [compost metagenome]